MAYLGVKPAAITSATEAEIAGDLTVDTNTLKVDSSNNRVGVLTTSPATDIHVQSSSTAKIRLESTATNGTAQFEAKNDAQQYAFGVDDTDKFFLYDSTGGASRLVVDTSGNLLVGKTAEGANNIGFQARPDGFFSGTRNGGTVAYLQRQTSDGEILRFQKNSSTAGSIGTHAATSSLEIAGGNNRVYFNSSPSPATDNTFDLGGTNDRFDDVFATNGTIQTSDQNEKQDIASLTTAEMTAAKAISKLFKTFKWQDKVAAKGDAARRHAGVIAQEVQTAMSDAGLNAAHYAFWCSDTWWETSTDVPAVEADEEAGIEARDAYTRIDTYETAEKAPEGATERTRLGIRYPELLAFIGSATEQRLSDIETRLTALETG